MLSKMKVLTSFFSSMDSGTKKQNFNNNKNKSQISSGTSINNKKPVQVEIKFVF